MIIHRRGPERAEVGKGFYECRLDSALYYYR